MSDHIVLLGSEGSMGRRYQAIFRHLLVPIVPVDTAYGPLPATQTLSPLIASSRGVVIATPTAAHAQLLRLMAPLRIPILCEKPILTSEHLVRAFL